MVVGAAAEVDVDASSAVEVAVGGTVVAAVAEVEEGALVGGVDGELHAQADASRIAVIVARLVLIRRPSFSRDAALRLVPATSPRRLFPSCARPLANTMKQLSRLGIGRTTRVEVRTPRQSLTGRKRSTLEQI